MNDPCAMPQRASEGKPSAGSGSQRKPNSGTAEARRLLLGEIGRLGGEEQKQGAQGALAAFENALAQLVREKPKAYGAGDDPENQRRVVAQLIESVRTPFLTRTVVALRHKAGYVQVFGCWIHRAAFTFFGFGLLAAIALPLCAVSLMSTRAWGWVPGAVGIILALGLGAWILTRVRNK